MSSQTQQVFSNSLINISSLQSSINNYTVTWCRKFLEGGQNDSWIVRRAKSYLCSPLDADYYVQALIQQENKTAQTKLYGPVVLQQKLIDVDPLMSYQIKTILNKNVPFNGVIDISDMPKIALKIQNKQMIFEYNYFLEDCWSKIICPPEEPSSIAINIKSIKKQFLQFLKQLKIFIHMGDTIKINFLNSFEKNLFLYELVKYRGVSRSVKKRLVTAPNIMLQKPNQFIEGFNIPVFESEEGEQNCDTKILEDLYDVIYTPTAKKGPKLFQNPQIQNEQNQKNNGKHLNSKQKAQKIIRGTTKQISKNIYLDELCDKQRFYSERDEESGQIHYKNNNEMKNITPMQQHIIKMNNFLLSENQRLRKENQCLKRDKQKLQKALDNKNNDKYSELKSFLQAIQAKIIKLAQQVNSIQNPSSFPKKNLENPPQFTHQNSKTNLPIFLRKQDRKLNNQIVRHKTDHNLHLYINQNNQELSQRVSTSPSTKSATGQRIYPFKNNLNLQQKK